MKKYDLILADPPWKYKNKVSRGAASDHYKTTDFYSLTRIPIETISSKNSILCMWYTGNFALEAIKLAEAWGFIVKTMKGFTWIKFNKHAQRRIDLYPPKNFEEFMNLLNDETKIGLGNYTRMNSEDCLIATRGNGLERKDASIKQVIYSCIDDHSKKPKEVHRRLEKLYGNVNRIELFARDASEGWDAWGNESPKNNVIFTK